MLVGVAPLPLSFPPPGTKAFYSINRPPWANISDPSVKLNFGICCWIQCQIISSILCNSKIHVLLKGQTVWKNFAFFGTT